MKKSKKESRKAVEEYKKDVEAHHNKEFVMQNRMSWSLFDKMRKAQGLGKRKSGPTLSNKNGPGTPKRAKKHGSSIDKFSINKELIHQASQWETNQHINWSKLAHEHRIEQKNGGQIVEEFLASQGFAAATTYQRADRRSKCVSATSKVSFLCMLL